MKHYIIEVIYTAPIEQIEAATPDHRVFLDSGYARSILLLSGPQIPRTGGMLVARAESLEAMEAFTHEDPFFQRNLARYRIVEVNPLKRQPFLNDWLTA